MRVAEVERLIAELTSKPKSPLDEQQKLRAFAFAGSLFAGHLDGLEGTVGMDMGSVQGIHALSSRQTFYLDYFIQNEEGRRDAARLGFANASLDVIQAKLLDTVALNQSTSATERKEIAERSADWYRSRFVEQLMREPSTDSEFAAPHRLTVHYQPERLLEKAHAIRRFRHFYRMVERAIAGEPDELLAEAKRALLDIHVGRLNAMAATDVYPALLSFEDQLAQSRPSDLVEAWSAALAKASPAIAAIHDLDGDERTATREVYVRHLDAIRQGAPFELDEYDEHEALEFSAAALAQLVEAVELSVTDKSLLPGDSDKQRLAAELAAITWDAPQVKHFIESILAEWNLLSDFPAEWNEIDDRDGFAPDEKYQVVITPRRKSMSVDSTRRILNIPADLRRPLSGLYPAGILPMTAHELAHVLQSNADYELGKGIPLATIKGRRYRILREAGAVYQEQLLNTEYFGSEQRINLHYLRAYQTKVAGGGRLAVARTFYDSLVQDRKLYGDERIAALNLVANRTARMYRRGGHNSQVLDYVEQMVVCQVLLRELETDQANAFLLGCTSFSLEDSVSLHQYGLLTLPGQAALSPVTAVMDMFYR